MSHDADFLRRCLSSQGEQDTCNSESSVLRQNGYDIKVNINIIKTYLRVNFWLLNKTLDAKWVIEKKEKNINGT